MQSAQNLTQLAAILSRAFTVYLPDRRGRGLSGPFGSDYRMEREVEDLAALLAKTRALNVFGLSSGALIALQAALTLPVVEKVALYEPPLAIDGAPSPMAWVSRYDEALARGDLASAMVACIKGTADPSMFTALPRFILTSLFRLAIRASANAVDAADAQAVPLATLIPTVHFDTRLAAEMAGTIDTFKSLRAEVLLIGGSRSADYLPIALAALAHVLPKARRVELSGLGHLAADNTGKPERVASELRGFFDASRDTQSSPVNDSASLS
jgi:pimeloyl-ACP methyl ester carboxylesterase